MMLILCLLLFGCKESLPVLPSEPEPYFSLPEMIVVPEKRIEDYLDKEFVSQSTDPEILTELWEAYIYPGYLNISNGSRLFDSPKEIDALEAARYLNAQMQREENTPFTEIIGSYSVPIDKLEQYSEKYFDTKLDFRNYPNKQELYVDNQTGLCYFYPNSTYDAQDLIKYDRLDLWPHFRIDYVNIYDNDVYMVVCSEQNAEARLGELYESRHLLQKREDGSFYYIALDGAYPKTNEIILEGNYEKLSLPFSQDIHEIFYVNQKANQMIVSVSDKFASSVYQLWDLSTGQLLNTLTFKRGLENSLNFMEVIGDRLIVVHSDIIESYDLSLNKISAEPLPQKIIDSVAKDEEDRGLYSINFATDFSKIAFVDGDGLKLYDFQSDTVRLVDTIPYNPQDLKNRVFYTEVWFVDNNTKLWAAKARYEHIAGYLLYDIVSAEFFDFPYGAGYDRSILLNERLVMLFHHYGEKGQLDLVKIDFLSKEVMEKESFSEERFGFYEQRTSYALNTKEQRISNLLSKSEFSIIGISDANDLFVREAGFAITAPSNRRLLTYIANDGTIYAMVSYLSEQYTLRIR